MKKTNKNKVKKPTQIQIKGWEIVPGTEGLPINPNIPTHHADIVNILVSGEGLALISFFSRTPGLNVEECRVSFSHVLAKKIVDLLCQQFNYYPQNPTHQIEKQEE